MALPRRYRWELGPLLIAASVVWARPLLPDETTGVLALWHLGIAALLAAGLVRVSRLGRPLLTALWEVTLARLGSLAAGYASIALRQQNLDLGSVGFGLLQTLMQVVAVGIVIWLAWRQGAGGRRYAMLVCAGYLVPRFSGWIGSAWIGPDPGLVVLVLAGATLALQLASVAAVAVAFGRFGELAAERQRRVVVWLLALPLAAAGLHSLLLFVQFGGQDRGVSGLLRALVAVALRGLRPGRGCASGRDVAGHASPLAARAGPHRCVRGARRTRARCRLAIGLPA